jgi:pimeloyl-ACP methyl ester carboxylesterase
LESFRAEIVAEIKELLHYHKSDEPLGVRHIVTTPRKGYRIEKVEFLSESGIYIPTWVFLPEQKRSGSPAILYVRGAGKQAEAMEFGALEKLTRGGYLVAAIDVRGIGDTKPPHPDEEPSGEFRNLDDAETAMAYWAWEINESLFGMRVQDVVRSLDYILTRPDVDPSGVWLIGHGMGALWSLYAAALDTRIRATVCDGGLLSYRSLTGVDRYLHAADIIVPGVLQRFDLPHVAAAVADRPLVLLSPVDAMKSPVGIPLARQTYQWTQATYAVAGGPDHFRVVGRSEEVETVTQYLHLLNNLRVGGSPERD